MSAPPDGVRLPGLEVGSWSPGVHALLGDALARVGGLVGQAGSSGAGNPLPTLTLIAHQEALLEPFLVWARALGLGATLSRRTAEIVALRTAFIAGSVFEWREHRLYALAAGLTEDEVAAVATGPDAGRWGAADRAALRAADDLAGMATIGDAAWADLQANFTPAEIVELILVAGQYRMLSTLANAAGVDRALVTGGDAEPGVAGLPAGLRPFAMDDGLLGLRDTVALVTGGSKSIGRGCAVALARAGCHVVIADLADGTAAAAEIEALGRRARYHHGDMRSKADIERIVDATLDEFGRLDVAVNTVGSTKGPKPFLDIEIGEWDDVVTQNLSTTVLSTQVEALAMIRLGIKGRIINVASLSGVAGAPNAAGYGAANAGVVHMTRSAALELARYGIRVNCIVPGTHYTEAVHEALARDPQIAEWVQRTGEACPLGRIGAVWETAGVAVFLASDLSSFVTGEEIVSDGGVLHTTARPPIGMAAEAQAVLRLRSS